MPQFAIRTTDGWEWVEGVAISIPPYGEMFLHGKTKDNQVLSDLATGALMVNGLPRGKRNAIREVRRQLSERFGPMKKNQIARWMEKFRSDFIRDHGSPPLCPGLDNEEPLRASSTPGARLPKRYRPYPGSYAWAKRVNKWLRKHQNRRVNWLVGRLMVAASMNKGKGAIWYLAAAAYMAKMR